MGNFLIEILKKGDFRLRKLYKKNPAISGVFFDHVFKN